MEKGQDNLRIVLGDLLTEIARRLDGAVDFWTVVCLSPVVPDRKGFLEQNLDELRCLIVVTKIMWPAQIRTHEIDSLLEKMAVNWQKLRHAFGVLEDFQARSIEAIEGASKELADVYHTSCELLRRLGNEITVEFSHWRDGTAEREEHLESILRNLANQFRGELVTKQVLSTASS
jgi:hypothetical protein